jgi:hypothetical protein
LSDFFHKSSTKAKRLYSPSLYVPISGKDDVRASRQWKHLFEPNLDSIYGLTEGFLGGNVEVLYLKDELVVVYHISQSDIFPASIPLGFISSNKDTIKKVAFLVEEYLNGGSSFEKSNDCGLISTLATFHS